MAKEYDPGKSTEVIMQIRKRKHGDDVFFVATCKEHNWSTTGSTQNEAALNFANEHMPRHPGCTVRRS